MPDDACCQQLLTLLAPDCLDDDDLATPKLPLPAFPSAQPSRQLAIGRQLLGLLQAVSALLQYVPAIPVLHVLFAIRVPCQSFAHPPLSSLSPLSLLAPLT